MLKKIRVEQLQVGMALHELCGSWLDHPFWTKRFVLRSAEQLAKLRASGVVECVIDTEKGLDLAPEPPVAPVAKSAPVSAEPAVPVAAVAAAVHVAPPKVRIEDEAAVAAALCRRSKESLEALFHDIRMGRALDANANLPLVGDIVSSVSRNAGALTSLSRLKTRDDYTYMHSVAVCALMVALGRKLGLDEATCREAGMAGLLHDIGKAVMPLAVLNKPGALTDIEYAIMKTHPDRGRELLRQGTGVGPIAIDVCGHHHERPDGNGYPDRISGDALSLFARMGAVCDVYDAITSDRPYKAGWDPAESIARMADWTSKGQFDPAVFQSFVDCMGIYPIGSMVRLQSGRLAVVIEQDATSAISPRVRVFFSTKSEIALPTSIVDLSAPGCRDRIVGRESNERWKFPYLDDLIIGVDPDRNKKTSRQRSSSAAVPAKGHA